eukprot:Nk52_evm17s745 gene=Nk52_evmTU17s745
MTLKAVPGSMSSGLYQSTSSGIGRLGGARSPRRGYNGSPIRVHSPTRSVVYGSGTVAQEEVQMPRFYFKPRREKIDWRALASCDLERIMREVDVNMLQHQLENVTFCDVDAEDWRYADPQFIKLFKLSQLIIEYLLYSQEFLATSREANDDKVNQVIASAEEYQMELHKKDEEIELLKKENRNRRKTIAAYQSMLNVGANGYFQCMSCKKAFVSAIYLQAHIERRHPDQVLRREVEVTQVGRSPSPPPRPATPSLTVAELQLELMKLTEKLRGQDDDMKRELERKMAEERAALRAKEEEMERAAREAAKAHAKALEDLRKMFEDQMKQQRADLEKALADKEKKSNLGELEDDSIRLKIRKEIERSEKETKIVKEERQTTDSDGISKALENAERKWSKRLEKLERQNRKYMETLNKSQAKINELEASMHTESKTLVIRPSPPQSPPQKREKVQKDEPRNPKPREPEPSSDLLLWPGRPFKYRPVKGRPFILARYDHESENLENERMELKDVLEKALDARGIPPGTTRLSAEAFKSRMDSLRNERIKRAKENGNFLKTRSESEQDLNSNAEATFKFTYTELAIKKTGPLRQPSFSRKKTRSQEIPILGSPTYADTKRRRSSVQSNRSSRRGSSPTGSSRGSDAGSYTSNNECREEYQEVSHLSDIATADVGVLKANTSLNCSPPSSRSQKMRHDEDEDSFSVSSLSDEDDVVKYEGRSYSRESRGSRSPSTSPSHGRKTIIVKGQNNRVNIDSSYRGDDAEMDSILDEFDDDTLQRNSPSRVRGGHSAPARGIPGEEELEVFDL